MANQPPSLAPADPYPWHESVLSTRSLSYISTISALGTNGHPSPLASRNPSLAHMYPPPPPSNMDEDSEYELVMADRRDRAKAMEESLPVSVAHSVLFSLPTEIRDRIWRYCVVVAEEKPIDWPPPLPYILDIAPQLLRTCKIVFAETAPILYSENQFGFAHPTDANIFVRAMTSPMHSGLIQIINLHMHTKDTRLWMAYLGSNNSSRSLKRDYPNLRELNIRYKSVKWNHNAPIDVNMRMWLEDRHLEELTDGLRQVYFPPFQHLNTAELDDLQLATVKSYGEADADMQEGLRDPVVRAKLQELRLLQERARVNPKFINVSVTCVCRVHPAHFQALTEPPIQEDDEATVEAAPAPPRFMPAGAQNFMFQARPGGPPLVGLPAREGAEFLGFTAVDFRRRGAVKPNMVTASGARAQVARTVFMYRKNIQLALEVYSFI